MEAYTVKLNENTKKAQELKLVSEYNFKTFNPREELKDAKNWSGIIIAKRRSGKTVLLKHICSEIKDWYSKVYLFSATKEFQTDAYDFIEPKNIINGFNESMVLDIWNKQKEKFKTLISAGYAKEDIPCIMFCFDDIITDPTVRNNKTLMELYVQGRHSNCCCIVLSQYFCALSPMIRNNCDLAICFKLIPENDQKQFVESYMSTESKFIGYSILRSITGEEYQALIVNMIKNKYKPDEYIRKFTASTKLKKFIMDGSKPKKSALALSNFTSTEPFKAFKDAEIKPRKKMLF
jgi:hypothetical protein